MAIKWNLFKKKKKEIDILPYVKSFRVCQQYHSNHLRIALECIIDDNSCYDILPLFPKLKWNHNVKKRSMLKKSTLCLPIIIH